MGSLNKDICLCRFLEEIDGEQKSFTSQCFTKGIKGNKMHHEGKLESSLNFLKSG